MNPNDAFAEDVKNNITSLGADQDLQALSNIWLRTAALHKWTYNFSWLGRPAIQVPNDAWAMQELIWAVRPDLIIETGIAHGGSLMFSASMLALLDLADATQAGTMLDPRAPSRRVLGLDIDIRAHNRAAIEAHPMANRIDMIEGSSIDAAIIARVHAYVQALGPDKKIMVCLDSNHTHDHVLAELRAYASLVNVGSYCVVFDTIVEDMPIGSFPDRPWDKGNNPKTAVWEFMKGNSQFEIDRAIQHKLQITVAPDGFLKRIA
jgi:cephalosporin hydroxylase